MKKFFLFFLTAVLLCSCSEDIAEDGTERGKLASVDEFDSGSGKQIVFLYNRTEEINSPDQSTAYFYYWMSYTVDSKTGKIISQNKFDAEETELLGSIYGYSYFLEGKGLAMIDHRKNIWLKNDEVMQKIFAKNPYLKNQVASVYRDLYKHIVIETKTGDIYLLNLRTLETVIKDERNNNPDFEFKYAGSIYGEVKLLTNFYNGIAIDDAQTLVVTDLDPPNEHKTYISVCTENADEIRVLTHEIYNLQKYDSTVFLDGDLFGLKDNIAFIKHKTELGPGGKEIITAYDWKSHMKIWDLDPVKLIKDESLNLYDILWKPDGNTFFIQPLSNDFTPVYYMDARTGKLIWKF